MHVCARAGVPACGGCVRAFWQLAWNAPLSLRGRANLYAGVRVHAYLCAGVRVSVRVCMHPCMLIFGRVLCVRTCGVSIEA